MLKSKEFGHLVGFFLVRDDLIGSTLVDLCEIGLGGSSRCRLQDNQYQLFRASVLLAPLLALASKSISKCWEPYVSSDCTIQFVFFWGLSSLFQHVDLVTTSLRTGFQVYLS